MASFRSSRSHREASTRSSSSSTINNSSDNHSLDDDYSFTILSANELLSLHKDKSRLQRKRIKRLIRRECKEVRSILLLLVTTILIIVLSIPRGCNCPEPCQDGLSEAKEPLEKSGVGDDTNKTTHQHVQAQGDRTSDIEKEIPIATKSQYGSWRICGRKVPFDLQTTLDDFNRDKYTYANGTSDLLQNKTVVLLDKEMTKHVYGGFGNQLSALFHSFDRASDEEAVVVMEGEGWGLFTISSFWDISRSNFSGEGNGANVQNSSIIGIDQIKTNIQHIFDVPIIENQSSIPESSQIIVEKPETYFFYSGKTKVTAEEKMKHRGDILRRLFLLSTRGTSNKDICSSLLPKPADGKNYLNDEKYSVIHPPPSGTLSLISRLNIIFGDVLDRSAIDMTPEYAKYFLNSTGMMNDKMFVIETSKGDSGDVINRLREDADIGSKLITVPADRHWFGSDIMLAVLSDVYLGNPLDTLSLWIARMRYALGINNTFVYTKLKPHDGSEVIDEWVSVGDEKFLYEKHGAWTG